MGGKFVEKLTSWSLGRIISSKLLLIIKLTFTQLSRLLRSKTYSIKKSFKSESLATPISKFIAYQLKWIWRLSSAQKLNEPFCAIRVFEKVLFIQRWQAPKTNYFTLICFCSPDNVTFDFARCHWWPPFFNAWLCFFNFVGCEFGSIQAYKGSQARKEARIKRQLHPDLRSVK